MREERGNLAGDLAINEPMTLWGSVAGNVTAGQGSKFYCRGSIYGNLTVEPGGRVHVFGNINGNLVVKEKTKVILSGTLSGDVTNLGGRLYIDATAQVMGKVKTQSGETTIEPQARIAGE